MERFDVLVIGTGSGMIVASTAVENGFKTAVVDSGPMGGTCLNKGCVPSKMLIYPSDVVAIFNEAQALAQAGGHKLEESYIVRHIAAEHQEDGNLDKALAGFERSLTLREQIGYKVYQPAALLAIGHVYRARQKLDQAIEYYQKAYNLAEQMNQALYVVRLQMAMGDAEKEKRNIHQALKHYETALRTAEAINYQNGLEAATAKIEAIDREL